MKSKLHLGIAAAILAAVILGVIVVIVVSGGSSSDEAASPIRSGETALADNAAQADEIVGSGIGAFETRLAALEGYPVVVNQWASWCENCRFELPFFQSAAAKLSDQVAFLGLDSRDNRGSAESFLQQYPSGFPSIFDENADIARNLGGGRSWPTTFFFDGRGDIVFTKIGAYANQDELERDIQTHALAGSAGQP